MTYRERLRELDQIVQHHQDALVQLRRVDPAELAKPVCDNKWTIAQVIDHMVLGHEVTLPVFHQATAASPALEGDSELKYALKEQMLLSVLGPKPFFKVPVPSPFRPSHPNDISGHLDRFEKTLTEFRQVIAAGQSVDLRKSRSQSPVDKRFQMSTMAYLDGLVRHLQYHWSQIERGRLRLGR